MPNEKMMRVFHVDDGENVNSYTVRDSHINLGYVTCSTAASTTAKEASFSEDIGWRLRAGSNIIVKFTYDVPANATLNVASTGAKAVYHKGTNVTSGVIKAGDVVTFIYDGTNYVITSIDRIMSGVFGEMSANDVIAALGYTPLNAAVKGASNGVAELDNNGKVPASQLPSYVDDVLEYNSLSAFPSTGEDDKIYVAKDTNKIYRWSGSGYVEISSSLALGETSSTAYRGDHGKVAYDHASAKGTAYASGMYKITTNGEGHVTAATPITQSDITGLGIKPTQTAVSDPSADGTGVEFIDTISQDTDGVVTATKKTVRTFSGATSSVDGLTGLVAAPSAGEEDKVLTGAGTWQYMSAASKTFELETVRNVSGSYTHNTSFADVTADMKPISLELSNPEIFLDVINVYCHDGYITLSCDSVVGTSTVKVTVLKQARGQNAEITSAEFDAIAARIGLENAGEDVSLTIPANGWSNSSPYTYTWESDKITTQCRVIVDFSNGTTVIDVPYVTYEKVNGGVQFTAPAQPTTDIPVKVHIIQDYATRVIDIDDETVSSNVVPGTSNVKEALIVLKNNLSNVTPTNAGTQGQILRSDGNGGCEWDNAATQQEIGTAVTTWLNNNIDPTETAVIDNTLSVAHAAAEAKTTGDEITHLKSALTSETNKIYYTVYGDNIANPNTMVTGSLDSSGNVSSSATSYKTTDFIPLEENTSYTLTSWIGDEVKTSRKYVALYDAEKQFISGSYQNVNNESSVSISSGSAKYARVSCGSTNTPFVKKGSTAPTAFVAYTEINYSKLVAEYYKNDTIPMEALSSDTSSKLLRKDNINLYVYADTITGVLKTNGAGVNTDNTSYKTSALFPVKAGFNYTVSPRVRICAFAANASYDTITSVDSTEYTEPHTYTAPADGFMTFSIHVDYAASATCVESFTGTPTKKVEEGIALSDTQIQQAKAEIGSASVLYGKKWAVCGDSFTHGGGTGTTIQTGKYAGKSYTYPWIIGNRCDMDIVQFFGGGRTLAFPETPGDFVNSLTCPTQDYYYQNIPSDVDYITIYLGINDDHHRTGGGDGEDPTGYIPLGSVDDTTTASYLGAWNVVLTWLITNRPNAHIGIIVTNGIANNDDYRLGQIAIAQKYGIPYIDMNGDERTPAMLRTSNPNISSAVKTALIQKWAVNPGSNEHPNDAAQLFESYVIENFLKSI